MALEIRIELEDSDLERFQVLFGEARKKAAKMEPQALTQAARQLVQAGLASDPPNFVRTRLQGLGQLVEMVEDTAWDLPEEERGRVMDTLTYFVAADDIIPDSTPVLGLLDDAIAAELALRALQPELDAYQEFSSYRATEAQRRANAGKSTDVTKEDWLADRRATLHSQMRARRASDTQGWHTITLWGND